MERLPRQIAAPRAFNALNNLLTLVVRLLRATRKALNTIAAIAHQIAYVEQVIRLVIADALVGVVVTENSLITCGCSHERTSAKMAGEHMKDLTIGQVSKETGVSIDAIRFYEKAKLLPPSLRKTSGYRQFDSNIIKMISFIRNAKGLGFTLGEIKELLALRSNPTAKSADVKQRTMRKIASVDDKIAKLLEIRSELSTLAISCDGQGLASECCILEGIAEKLPTECAKL